MQALCGLQGIFDLFNCKTPEYILIIYEMRSFVKIFFGRRKKIVEILRTI